MVKIKIREDAEFIEGEAEEYKVYHNIRTEKEFTGENANETHRTQSLNPKLYI